MEEIEKIEIQKKYEDTLSQWDEIIEAIKEIIEFIYSDINNYYNYLRILLNRIDYTYNINCEQIIEKIEEIKEQIKFKEQFHKWYIEYCYRNEINWTHIENFDCILQEINENIENINKQNKDIKMLIENKEQLYSVFGEELESQYSCMVKRINICIKEVNDIANEFCVL